MTMYFFPSPFLPVWLSLYDLVPSCGKFHVGKNMKGFLFNDWEHYSWTRFAFAWDTQSGLEDLFDQPLSLVWISPLPPLGITLGIGSLKPVRSFPISRLQRSSAWSWCRWSCPGIIWFWNHWRVLEPRGNTQMKKQLRELKLLTKVFHVVTGATDYVVLNLWALIIFGWLLVVLFLDPNPFIFPKFLVFPSFMGHPGGSPGIGSSYACFDGGVFSVCSFIFWPFGGPKGKRGLEEGIWVWLL